MKIYSLPKFCKMMIINLNFVSKNLFKLCLNLLNILQSQKNRQSMLVFKLSAKKRYSF